MTTTPNRQPAGTPTGGQFAAGTNPAAEASAGLASALTVGELCDEVGAERPVHPYTDAGLENVRVVRTADGYEARGDLRLDLTIVYAESYEGFDTAAGEDLDDATRERAVAFLDEHRTEVGAFLKERWGATADDTAGWDDRRLTFTVPVAAGTVEDEVGMAFDEDEKVARFVSTAFGLAGAEERPLRTHLESHGG